MIRQTLYKLIERWLFQTRTKGSIQKKLLTVIKQRLIEMAKTCQSKQKIIYCFLRRSNVLPNTKAKSNNDTISSKAVVAQRRCYQDIKNQEPRDQDTKTRQGGSACFALLACLDGSCLEGRTEAMLGLDRKIQFRIVNRTPQGVRRVQ